MTIKEFNKLEFVKVMKKIKILSCKIGFHKWKYSFGSFNLITRQGYDWRDCKWYGKSEKVEY